MCNVLWFMLLKSLVGHIESHHCYLLSSQNILNIPTLHHNIVWEFQFKAIECVLTCNKHMPKAPCSPRSDNNSCRNWPASRAQCVVSVECLFHILFHKELAYNAYTQSSSSTISELWNFLHIQLLFENYEHGCCDRFIQWDSIPSIPYLTTLQCDPDSKKTIERINMWMLLYVSEWARNCRPFWLTSYNNTSSSHYVSGYLRVKYGMANGSPSNRACVTLGANRIRYRCVFRVLDVLSSWSIVTATVAFRKME